MGELERAKEVFEGVKDLLQRIVNENPELTELGAETEDIYYLNGKNGTEGDYFANEHLPPFAIGYPDEISDMLAVKLAVYRYGDVNAYVYKPNERKPIRSYDFDELFDEKDVKILGEFLEDTWDKKRKCNKIITTDDFDKYEGWECTHRFRDEEENEEDMYAIEDEER